MEYVQMKLFWSAACVIAVTLTLERAWRKDQQRANMTRAPWRVLAVEKLAVNVLDREYAVSQISADHHALLRGQKFDRYNVIMSVSTRCFVLDIPAMGMSLC